MIIVCNHCKSKVDKPTGHVNRAKKIGAPQYCNKLCAGLGRRLNITVEEKKKLKKQCFNHPLKIMVKIITFLI